MYDLKLPTEWVQMFRILLSIYLAWLILLSPRKPIFNNNLLIRCIFVLLIVLFGQSDIISALLILLIYFFSFQVILPMENFANKTEENAEDEEDQEESSNPTESPLIQMMDENLKRGYEPPTAPTKLPRTFTFKNNYRKLVGLGPEK